MPISRELRSGTSAVEYPLYDFFLITSQVEPSGTKEILSNFDCSYETCYQKLRTLKNLGAIRCDRLGNSCLWEINHSSTDDFESLNSSVDIVTLASLILDALDDSADALIRHSPLKTEIPTKFEDWLIERRMNHPDHQAEVLARAAVFDIYLKSTLYSLYQAEHEELDTLSFEDNFLSRFCTAKRITMNKGFSELEPNELSEFLPSDHKKRLLALRNALHHHNNPASVLSKIHEYLFPQEVRRDLGQFATPTRVSRFMANWAVGARNDVVLDPGSGAGVLSSEVVREKMNLGCSEPLRDIIAIDIDGLSISMAAVSLKLINGPGSPTLIKENFLEFDSHTWTAEGRVPVEQVDAVVANPPYSRSQAIENEFKEKVNRIFSARTGIDFHGKSPLYVYFIAHASQFVSSGGRLGFIIPNGFMETEYGIPFKEYLLESFTIEAIVQLSGNIQTFNGVRATASLVFLTKEPPEKDHETTFINLGSWPETESLEELLNTDFSNESAFENAFQVKILQRLLEPSENWKHYLSPTEVDSLEGVCKFSDIASIKRGIATGNNELFCLSDDDITAYDIPEEYLEPIIKSARYIPGYSISIDDWENWREDGKDVWLLYCFEDGRKVVDPSPRLENFLSIAKKKFDTDRNLLNHRSPWYCVDKREVAPIFAKYMSRTGPRFVYNDAGVRTLNNLHVIYPEFGDDEVYVKSLLAYLNSTIVRREMSKVSRTYSGLEKIELSALKSAPVIDPRELSLEAVQNLAGLFDELEDHERDGRDPVPILNRIDALVMDLLNISINEGHKGNPE